jgi:hypothetical protein
MITQNGNQPNLNYLSGNRAVFTIPELSDLSFTVNNFELPGVTLPAAYQATQNISKPVAGETLEYTDLNISFIVMENLSNWLEIHNWMRALGAPFSKQAEYLKDYPRWADGYVTVYSAKNNPLLRVKFIDVVPVALGTLSFSEEIQETTTMTCSVTFSYERYDLEFVKP